LVQDERKRPEEFQFRFAVQAAFAAERDPEGCQFSVMVVSCGDAIDA
jgi:hypothetical protein